jgi:hypothetical protein
MAFASVFHRFGVILACLLAAAAIGWIAFQLQQQQVLPAFFFPLLFPLLTGAVVGAACAFLLRRALPGTATMLLVAATGGLIAVAAETLTGYQYYLASVERQMHNHPMAALARGASDDFAPATLARFVVIRMRGNSGWWIIDAMLTVAASTTVCWAMTAKASAAGTTGEHRAGPDL